MTAVCINSRNLLERVKQETGLKRTTEHEADGHTSWIEVSIAVRVRGQTTNLL